MSWWNFFFGDLENRKELLNKIKINSIFRQIHFMIIFILSYYFVIYIAHIVKQVHSSSVTSGGGNKKCLNLWVVIDYKSDTFHHPDLQRLEGLDWVSHATIQSKTKYKHLCFCSRQDVFHLFHGALFMAGYLTSEWNHCVMSYL